LNLRVQKKDRFNFLRPYPGDGVKPEDSKNGLKSVHPAAGHNPATDRFFIFGNLTPASHSGSWLCAAGFYRLCYYRDVVFHH
jgi:hypothetical protein